AGEDHHKAELPSAERRDRVGVDQILRADKQAFLRMAELLPKGLKRDPAGILVSVENPFRSHLWDTSFWNKFTVDLNLRDISGQISEILDQGFHKAGALAALRGRLQFAETQIAGRQ
ncbi:unnamed protein product, partial [Effrenium voratum]